MSVPGGNKRSSARYVMLLKQRTERLKNEILINRSNISDVRDGAMANATEIALVKAGAIENRQRILSIEGRVDDLEGTGV